MRMHVAGPKVSAWQMIAIFPWGGKIWKKGASQALRRRVIDSKLQSREHRTEN